MDTLVEALLAVGEELRKAVEAAAAPARRASV